MQGFIILAIIGIEKHTTEEDFFTFFYCKSTGDDDPGGVANLDPGSMICRIFVGYH